MSKRKWKKPVNAFLATSMVASVVAPVVPTVANAESATPTDLIISEYIEGSSFNKAIEIYNGTGKAVDLSEYSLELYSNGATETEKSIELSGILAHGDTYVLYHPDASDAIKSIGDSQDSFVINFNGDDPVVLKKSGEIIDSIGKIGVRDEFGKDITLVRKSSVLTGDINPNDEFDRTIEWDVLSKDTITHLGSHEMDVTSGDTGTVDPGEENPGTEEPVDPNPEESQVISIADARVAVGQTVQIEGTVTTGTGYWGSKGFYIQDGDAGIYVYTGVADVQAGDKVLVTGEVSEYRGELQVQPTTVEVGSSNNMLPDIQVVTPSGVNEETQGELVEVRNVKITNLTEYNYGTFEFTAVAESGEEILVRHDNRNGSNYDEFTAIYNEGDIVNISGIASKFNETFQLKTLGLDSYELVEDVEVEPQPEEPVETVSIADARTAGEGATVSIEGIATTKTGLWGYDTFYMQDDTAGMLVFGSPKNVQPGDKVKITGKLLTYNNELEIDPSNLEIVSSGNNIPEAQVISPSDVNESTQGELLKLENITITDLKEDNYGGVEFYAEAGDGEKVKIIHDNRTGTLYSDFIKYYKEGDKIHLIGIGSINRDGFHLKTTSLESYDLVNKPAVYVTQAQGTVPANTKIELKSGIEGADIYYTTDGSEPTQESTPYTQPIVLETGETTIKAIAVNDDATSKVFSFTYTILNTEGVTIRDIQGNGHVSAYEGASVKGITGVVTHRIDGSNFVIQDVDNADDDHTTSEAILVNKSSHGVQVGDKVTVDGIVEEDGGGANLSKTRIKASSVTKDGTAELPAPLIVGTDIMPPNKVIDNDNMTSFDPTEDGIDFWESVEFMRVAFPDAKIIGPSYNGDVPIVVESTTNNKFNVHGGLNIAADDYNPEKIFLDNVGNDFVSGDSFDGDVTGVISYSSTGYQLLTDELPEVIKGNTVAEVTHIAPAEDKLTVAAYNIENFSNNKSNTPDEKVARIAKSFVENMKSPDIITLVEVQDNDGQTDSGNADASQSYERLIAAIKAAGGPAYEWTDVTPINNDNGGAPGGNIRVGYLYNPDRVSLVEGIKGTGSQANSWTEDGNLTLNPGVINPSKFPDTRKPIAAEFEFQGERVVVIGTHLNSKGGDQSLWGSNQPPKLNSEAERHGLAQAINDFIDEGLAKNPDLNIVLAGDMNDFEFTKTFDILKGDVLTNMVDKAPVEDRFSYFFQGNNQVLDHILVSKNLEYATTIDMIHINANFTKEQGQASDHDPVLVQIDLKAADNEEPEAPITAEKVYNLTNYKTGKLIINKPSVSVTIDNQSQIKNGIVFRGEYAEFAGEGMANVTLTIKPKQPGAIIDLKNTKVGKIIIDGPNVSEIRGATADQEIEYRNGARRDEIKFSDSPGEGVSTDPSSPTENQSPVIVTPIPNQTVNVGEEFNLNLADYFADPDGDEIFFESTLGTLKEGILSHTFTEVGSYIINVTISDGDKSIPFSFTVTIVEDEVSSYYQDAYGKTGQELKKALHEIIDDHTQLSYSQVWEALRETDEDPNNPNNVILFYSGESRSENKNGGNVGDWNREHVWAKSHGNFGTSKGPGTDIHHLRPTDVQVNSSRGNLDFDNGGSPVAGCDDCSKDGDSFEPPDRVKGDVARMLFYMATRYENGDRVDLELNERVNNGSNPYHGKLSVLLEWHKQDPVDEFEKNRNDVIQEWQGNRNPFIDHPEWVEKIWK